MGTETNCNKPELRRNIAKPLRTHHSGTMNTPHNKLRPTTRGNANDYKHPPGFLVPHVNPNRCEGKGPCVEVCPVDVFAMGTLPKAQRSTLTLQGKVKGFVHGWKQVQVVHPEACRACGLCVTACPEKAITLQRGAP